MPIIDAAKLAAAKLVEQKLFKLWEEISGNLLSKKKQDEIKCLNYTIYKAYHGQENENFKLVDGKPTKTILTTNWMTYLAQIKEGKQLSGNFNTQSLCIAEHIAHYLQHRFRGYMKGHLGFSLIRNDILDITMVDLLDWSINELPRLAYSDAGIKELETKYNYVRAIKNADNKTLPSFQYNTIYRSRHLETLRVILRNIKSCILYATQQKSKQSVREFLNEGYSENKEFTNAATQMIYHMRAGDSPDLNFERYYYPQVILKDTDSTYSNIKKTHIGLMIFQIIHLTKPHNLGSYAWKDEINVEIDMEFKYYDDNYNCNLLDKKAIEAKAADLPLWISWKKNNCKQAEEKVLLKIQRLGSLILKASEISQLLESANAIAAGSGNNWAYGDKKGKQAVSRLLAVWKKTIDQVKLGFDSFISEQKKLHDNYSDDIQVKEGSAFNNFNSLLSDKPSFNDSYQNMCGHITGIHKQMRKYPVDADKQFQEGERELFDSLERFYKVNFADSSTSEPTKEKQEFSSQSHSKFKAGRFFSTPKIHGLTYLPIAKDGNCLYNAVAIYLEPHQQDQQTLRTSIAERIKANPSKYQNIIQASGKDFDSYIKGIQTNEWADHLEIVELMNLLDRPIVVIGEDHKIANRLDIGDFKGEPIFVYYNGIHQQHYDGLRPPPNVDLKNLLNTLMIPDPQTNNSSKYI